ncbi:MAG TPA: hypothetical protein VK616_11475 [Flavitalea sp.]|nr:hypothetical protein [Flavitalea sp.]HTF31186.1 hypothetical protein [Flavitalea sp.]
MQESFAPSSPSKVTTVHILDNGRIVGSLQEFQLVEDRFAWVSRADMISRLLTLRRVTDPEKKSIIAIYEEGHVIREFVNLDEHFPVAALLNQQPLSESNNLL